MLTRCMARPGSLVKVSSSVLQAKELHSAGEEWNRPLRWKLAQALFLWFLLRGWGGKGLSSTEQPGATELLVGGALGQLR